MRHFSRAPLQGSLLASFTHIRLGWKGVNQKSVNYSHKCFYSTGPRWENNPSRTTIGLTYSKILQTRTLTYFSWPGTMLEGTIRKVPNVEGPCYVFPTQRPLYFLQHRSFSKGEKKFYDNGSRCSKIPTSCSRCWSSHRQRPPESQSSTYSTICKQLA